MVNLYLSSKYLWLSEFLITQTISSIIVKHLNLFEYIISLNQVLKKKIVCVCFALYFGHDIIAKWRDRLCIRHGAVCRRIIGRRTCLATWINS